MKEKAKIKAIVNEKEEVQMTTVGTGQDLLILTYIIIKHLAKIFKIDEKNLINMLELIAEADNKNEDDMSKLVLNILKGL